MKKQNEVRWIPLGHRYDLNKDYKDSYTHAIFAISEDGKQMKVELWSNWNSSYNTTEIHKNFCTALDVIFEYIA